MGGIHHSQDRASSTTVSIWKPEVASTSWLSRGVLGVGGLCLEYAADVCGMDLLAVLDITA